MLKFKDELVEWFHDKAKEGIIDAIQSEDECSLKCAFLWKTPMYPSTIKRQVKFLVEPFQNIACKALGKDVKISAASLQELTDPSIAVLPTAGTRWLQLLKGTMNGLPLAEVVERYGVNIEGMQRALVECGMKREDFKNFSVESLVLHHQIHQRLRHLLHQSLGALCRPGDSDVCLGQPSEQQRRTEPVLQPAEGVAGLGAHGKAPAITATIKTPDPATVPSSSGRSADVSHFETPCLVSGKLNHCCERSFSCMASCMGAR